MRWWWEQEIEDARARADRAEQELPASARRRAEAEEIDARAMRAETSLRNELVRNNFADALRVLFRGRTA